MGSKNRRFYLRFNAPCGEQPGIAVLEEFQARVRNLGRCWDSGVGTAKDKGSMWVELHARANLQTIEAVRDAVTKAAPSASLQEVVEIDYGEGRLQSKQLDLLKGIA